MGGAQCLGCGRRAAVGLVRAVCSVACGDDCWGRAGGALGRERRCWDCSTTERELHCGWGGVLGMWVVRQRCAAAVLAGMLCGLVGALTGTG